mmetsp:Transcript_136516/g.248207  ORF Transcript_136516/g.248207 Transcript_136516/m.248207 type:complete len:234 (-) Transcript_136516:74-775(-)
MAIKQPYETASLSGLSWQPYCTSRDAHMVRSATSDRAYGDGLHAECARGYLKSCHIGACEEEDAPGFEHNPWNGTCSSASASAAFYATQPGACKSQRSESSGLTCEPIAYEPIETQSWPPMQTPQFAHAAGTRRTHEAPTSASSSQQQIPATCGLLPPWPAKLAVTPKPSSRSQMETTVTHEDVAPSAGSVGHIAKKCRPCHYFFSRIGCKNGIACEHCHFQHARRRRARLRF